MPIIDADVRWESFYVCFQDQRVFDKKIMSKEENIFKLYNDICLGIKIDDLELYKDGNATDELIKASLLDNYKDWLCKVEVGHIKNLKG